MTTYSEVALEMVRCIPELSPCYDRMVRDWDNFGGEPPRQYLLLNDLCGVCVDVLASLPPATDVDFDLTRRVLDFGEELVGSEDPEVRNLGVDAIAERLDLFPRGRTIVAEMGGPALKSWFSQHGRTAGPWRDPGEIIDLWGVREQLVVHVPQLTLAALAGVSAPRPHQALGSLEDAKNHRDGSVLLAAYGTSHLFVVARADLVDCAEGRLVTLATDLAPGWHEGNHSDAAAGNPKAHYFAIPPRERVWNMSIGTVRHARFESDLWVAESLSDQERAIRAVLDGSSPQI